MGPGRDTLEALFRYIKDEHQEKTGEPLEDEENWSLIDAETPQQDNGKLVIVWRLTSLLPECHLSAPSSFPFVCAFW